METECGLWILALLPIAIFSIPIVYIIAAIQGKKIE
jgi:hypothetical protein